MIIQKAINSYKNGSFVNLLIVSVLSMYSLWSSPFPTSYGLPEALIATSLVVTTLFFLIDSRSTFFNGQNIYTVFAVSYLIFVPLIIGLFHWAIIDVIRDFVPMLYIAMPLLFYRYFHKYLPTQFVSVMQWVAGFAGLLVSIRFFYGFGFDLADVGKGGLVISDYSNNFLYFPYDPLVLYSSVFFIATAALSLRVACYKSILISIVCIVLSLIPAASLSVLVQRAPILIILLALFFSVIHKFITKPIDGVVVILLFMCVFMLLENNVIGTLKLVIHKTNQVGLNGKESEITAIQNSIYNNSSSRDGFSISTLGKLFFGIGWGGKYYNPVLHDNVRFAHSIYGYFLLKSGILGTLSLLIYLYWLLKLYVNCFWQAMTKQSDKIPFVIAIGTILPICFLQATYKTLSFGIILTFIPACYIYMQNSKGVPQNGQ